MGQRGFSSSSVTTDGDSGFKRSQKGNCNTFMMIPTEPVNVEPTALPISKHMLTSSRGWLSETESSLTHEWLIGRKNQRLGVASTSPLVSLQCSSVEFPENRTTAIIHTRTEGVPLTDIPVGREYFLALQSAWRKENPQQQQVSPPPNARKLSESSILCAIEDSVGTVMSPPVPLSYMVGDFLVPQWELEGLYGALATRTNTTKPRQS